jgi:hypothetical protein
VQNGGNRAVSPAVDMHSTDCSFVLVSSVHFMLNGLVNMLPASKLQVAEATSLLHQWPKLAVEKALELLDYAYADQAVRHFAVQCLRDVR